MKDIAAEWANHPLGKNLAHGGRNALRGFYFQFVVTLDRFFDRVISGNLDNGFIFEGISDLARADGDLFYLIQCKLSLDLADFRDAAKEALKIDQFLEETHPELQDKFRFQLVANRPNSSVWQSYYSRSASDLGIDPEYSERWDKIRNRFLPSQIVGDPKLSLVTRLWNHVDHSFPFIERCLGILLDHFEDDSDCDRTNRKLIEHFDRCKVHRGVPGRLLGPADLAHASSKDGHVLQGQVPRLEDLNSGAFMDRPSIVRSAVATVSDIKEKDSTGDMPRINIVWISGGSGAGKSIVALQIMKELLFQGVFKVAHYLAEHAGDLHDAISYWLDQSDTPLIVVDDGYAPEHRTVNVWPATMSRLYQSNRDRPIWILTCGPKEHLKAFKQLTSRHREANVVELTVSSLGESERCEYHAWYQSRKGVQVKQVPESILVVATFKYEIAAKSYPDAAAFVARFMDRMRELGIAELVKIALSMNQLGISVPERMFSSKLVEIDQLRQEEVYRTAETGAGIHKGRFFHPQIARLIYDEIADRNSHVERALDIVQGIEFMMQADGEAETFLNWLLSGRSKSLLDQQTLLKAIELLISRLCHRELTLQTAYLLHLCAQIAANNEQTIKDLGLYDELKHLLYKTPLEGPGWPLVFQAVFPYHDADDLEKSVVLGQQWLEQSLESPAWSYVACLVIKSRMSDSLGDLAIRWLHQNSSSPGWTFVWMALLDKNCADRRLITEGLRAVPKQPDSVFEIRFWKRLLSIGALPKAVASACLIKTIRTRITEFRSWAIAFLIEEWQAIDHDLLVGTMRSRMNEPYWTHVWRELVAEGFEKDRILPVGMDWLKGREDRAEWNYVWQMLVAEGFEKDRLLPVGMAWLEEREERAGWTHVWQVLVAEGLKKDAILPVGMAWLEGREDRADWNYVWQTLVAESFDKDRILPVGMAWLEGREDRADWAFVWQALVAEGFERRRLITVGREWLSNNAGHPSWRHVKNCMSTIY